MPGRPRDDERRQERQNAFLAAFAKTGIISRAAEESGVIFTMHHRWMKEDAGYAERFGELKQQTADLAKQVRKKGGVPKGYVHGGQRGARKLANQDKFLAALSESGIVAEAERDSGVKMGSHYHWMDADPAYANRAEQILAATESIRREKLAAKTSKASKARWDDPDRRRAWSEYQRTAWTAEKRAEAGRRARERMEDPEYRAAWLAVNTSPMATEEGRARHSAMMKEKWADPEYRERQLEGMRSPERRQKTSETTKAQWARMSEEERREAMRKRRVVFKGGFRLTQIEATVISALNDLGAWYRVHAKVDGYVADIFVQPDLVVECDGAWFHDQRPDTDEIRDRRLADLGFRTLRLGEKEIKDGSFVLKLQETLKLSTE